MGNGARAQQKRERNAGKNAGGEAKSQLKSNAAAQNIKCKVCMQTFLSTSRKPALEEHVKAKHDGKKSYEDCFAGQEIRE